MTSFWRRFSRNAGAVIGLAVLAVNLVGEGLNDALNPRLKERGD